MDGNGLVTGPFTSGYLILACIPTLVERSEKMNRCLIILFVLLSGVIFVTAPACARGIMRDLGAAGSLDQRYQTDTLLERAPPPIADSDSNRPKREQNPDTEFFLPEAWPED
jgi:hypothetical protein